MDGLLIIDKPAGPTSHDVVARMRRVLREKRIGHTGTLDPAATGVLALVLGRATRLAQFLSRSHKSYEAVVRFGFSTDTADAQGRVVGAIDRSPLPSREAIDSALDAFRGTFLQQPPAFSAKRIDGKRSHKLARAHARTASDAAADGPSESAGVPRAALVLPAPAAVEVTRLEIVSVEGDSAALSLDCSAGFYVRSLAHDLGERLGVGAHLASLRRTRTGDFTAGQAIGLEAAERDPEQAAASVIPLANMLPFTSIVLTADGVRRAINGCELGRVDFMSMELPAEGAAPLYCLLGPTGDLVAIARRAGRPGFLHPSVVLM